MIIWRKTCPLSIISYLVSDVFPVGHSFLGGLISRDEAEDFDDDAIESQITDDDVEPDERDIISKCTLDNSAPSLHNHCFLMICRKWKLLS